MAPFTSRKPAGATGDGWLASRGAAVALAALLAAAVAVVYLPVLDHEFVALDDREFLVDNPKLAEGLSREAVGWALTTTLDGNWIPLTWLSFLVDAELHGLSPAGTHAGNVALHALASVLLFLALRRLTGAAGPSAFTAGVFALHPLHVESVAWAIERKDVLSGALFSATLLAYARHAERPSVGRYTVVALLFAAGLLAKPMLVTVPFVLLLLDAWPLGRLGAARPRRNAVLEKLPLLALSAAVSAVTLLSQSEAGSVNLGGELGLAARLGNALLAAVTYLRQALWPRDLAILYPHPGSELPIAPVALAAAWLLGLSALVLLERRRRPWLLVGWLWYLGMLVPVLGLVQVGVQAHADRYTYLPLVGATLALAFGASELGSRGRPARAALAATALLVLAGCGVGARLQLSHWSDTSALFRRALAVDENNAPAHQALGMALLEQDETGPARRHLARALELDPDFVDAHVNLGIVLLRAGELERARQHLERGLGLPPERVWRVRVHLAQLERRAGRPDRALAHVQRALAEQPARSELRVEVGLALADLGRVEEAEQELARAEREGVQLPELHVALAGVARARGDSAEAARRYRRALALRPGWPLAANDLAWILATEASPALRDPEAAVRLAEQAAVATGGADPNVLDTLSVALFSAGRSGEAVPTARRAARLARQRGATALAVSIEARLERWASGDASAPPATDRAQREQRR